MAKANSSILVTSKNHREIDGDFQAARLLLRGLMAQAETGEVEIAKIDLEGLERSLERLHVDFQEFAGKYQADPESVSSRIRGAEDSLFKAQKLKAMSIAVTGDGFEHFSSMNEDSQHWYIKTISDLASEVVSDLGRFV